MIKTRVFNKGRFSRSAGWSQRAAVSVYQFIHIPLRKFWRALIFPFMVTEGIIKVWFFFFLLSGCFTTQTRPRHRWNMYQERWSCGLCKLFAFQQGQPDQHLSTDQGGGAGPRWGGWHPIGGRSVWRTGEKTPGKEPEPPDARCNGTRRSSCAKRELCMDMRIFSGDNSPFLTGKKEF